jgi:hypothetical protein
VGNIFFFLAGGDVDVGGIIAMLGSADKFVSVFDVVGGIIGGAATVSVVAGILESSSDSLAITAMSDGLIMMEKALCLFWVDLLQIHSAL